MNLQSPSPHSTGWGAHSSELDAYPPALVRICLAPAHRQACVQQQHAAIGPWRQQTALFRWGLVVWVVDLQRFIDVGEGGGSGCGWADGEGEAVGLVGAVVGVLACDDDLYRV